MNTPESTAAPTAADAEKHATRTAVIARQLDQIAPGTARVQTIPVPTNRDGEERRATWVVLGDALGGPVKADRDAHRAARGLLLRMFPAADWTRPQVYDAITGALDIATRPVMPEELRR
ncbi:hypothetical protein [Streptomyces sp. NPDC086777]|uniref:hypothetical protein n=1 Tax=Streptomyces sp. NPDC086777 TaxID=3154866 RepID=UPI00344C4245